MRTWEIRYRLVPFGGKYFFKRDNARYQHEAVQIFQSELPFAFRCGNAREI